MLWVPTRLTVGAVVGESVCGGEVLELSDAGAPVGGNGGVSDDEGDGVSDSVGASLVVDTWTDGTGSNDGNTSLAGGAVTKSTGDSVGGGSGSVLGSSVGDGSDGGRVGRAVRGESVDSSSCAVGGDGSFGCSVAGVEGSDEGVSDSAVGPGDIVGTEGTEVGASPSAKGGWSLGVSESTVSEGASLGAGVSTELLVSSPSAVAVDDEPSESGSGFSCGGGCVVGSAVVGGSSVAKIAVGRHWE